MHRERLLGQTPVVKICHVESLLQHFHHKHLSTETVKRTSLTLERIHHIQTRHGLSLRVLGVGDGVTDDAFEESLEDTAGFFVDHWGEALV